ELRLRTVDEMEESWPALGDLISENADIRAGIEHRLAGIIDLAGEQILGATPPWAPDTHALNGRTLCLSAHSKGDRLRSLKEIGAAGEMNSRPWLYEPLVRRVGGIHDSTPE